MLRKRKKVKRQSILTTLMRDMQGSAGQKLALFEKLKTAGGFAREEPAKVRKTEKMLRTLAATEKESG